MAKKYDLKTYLADYWSFLQGKRTKFCFFTFLRALSSLSGFFIVFLIGWVVDFLVIYKKGEPLTNLYLVIIAIAFIGGFQVWLRFFAKLRMMMIGGEIRKKIRVQAMSKLIDLDLKWHETEETGSKIEKVNKGADAIFEGVRKLTNEYIEIFIRLFGTLVIFAVFNWKYVLFTVIYIMIYIYGEKYFNKKLSYLETKTAKIREKVSGKIYESSSNLLTVKSLGLKKIFTKSTRDYENKYYKTWLKTRKFAQLKVKTIKMFAAIGFAGFILLICYDAIAGSTTVGMILVYANYFGKLRFSLESITHQSSRFIQLKTQVGRFMTIFGKEIFDRNGKGLIKVSKNWKTIEFRNIEFKYKNELVLKNFNLLIKKGEKIGIVGRSGCGKSTLVKLILGLYQPCKGEILIDGKNLNKYKHNSITKTVSVVLQESEMFNISLIKNIIISSVKKNLKLLKIAIKTSQLQPIIKKLPNNINTLVGEKGNKLSGGERQRVGIARALYKNSDVLILDEATSSLDSKTEQSIQENLENYFKNKTILIIAHRLSTLKNVDKIIVMKKGKIIEEGTFDELIDNKRDFHKLYKLQKRR